MANRDNKAINSNKQFMIGNGLLAFGIFFIVCIFLYISFKSTKKEEQTFSETFVITIDKSIAPDSIAVFVNDSLLLRQSIRETTTLMVKRFAESSMLMIANERTQATRSFNLNPETPKVKLRKDERQQYQEDVSK